MTKVRRLEVLTSSYLCRSKFGDSHSINAVIIFTYLSRNSTPIAIIPTFTTIHTRDALTVFQGFSVLSYI